MTSFRWTVCALIFFATTVNYFDRQLFSVLVPFIEKDFKLTPLNLAFINSSFVLPYGLSMLFVGRQIDKVGVKKGLSVGYLIWSAASFLHAFVPGMQALAAARMLLGVGESALYPTGVKTMSEWFPTKERALATGIFNAGANGGAMLAPILGVWLEAKYGWRSCFMVTAAAGLVWLFFWRRLYQPPDESSRVSKEELDYIRSDRPANQPSLTVRQVLSIPSVYGLIIAKALTDGPFWFYLFWMPKFLVDQCHMKPSFMQWSLPVIYVVADIGSIAGGWASSRLVRRGVPVRRSRQTVMLVCAVLVLPVIPIGWVDPTFQGAYFAVAAVALASGAHQGWSCNLFTLISDTVPSGSTALTVGIINGLAMVGVMAMQFFVGWSVQVTKSYMLPFLVAGSLYLVALAILQLFMPRNRVVAAA